jgi:ComF family protein
MFSLLSDPLLSILYPQYCGACGRFVEKAEDGAACRDCWEFTTIFDASNALCAKCGSLLIGAADVSYSTCKHCDDHRFDLARAAGMYEKALAASILRLKRVANVSSTVRKCFIKAFEEVEMPVGFTVVPVPLSRRRLLERGFNQASLLARVIADHTGQPIDEHSLIRKQDTPMHRAAMDRKAREATVKNAFAVVRPALIEGRNILLVDDLMTSGSTASHCAKVLKKSGAEKVIVLTLARAA